MAQRVKDLARVSLWWLRFGPQPSAVNKGPRVVAAVAQVTLAAQILSLAMDVAEKKQRESCLKSFQRKEPSLI